ncbi:MAG: hypothetical protein ACK45T_01235 [Pseudanabaena sp.]
MSIVVSLPLVFKSSGVVGLIYVIFAKAGFLLKFILNGKSKAKDRVGIPEIDYQQITV